MKFEMTEIGYSDGGLIVKEEGGRYFWGISDHDGTVFEEIEKSLYDELLNHYEKTGLIPMLRAQGLPRRFHAGQIWESPRGTLYKVVAVQRGGQATLRLGVDGSGRIVRRAWDAVRNWAIHST